jgi:hypothetical protein
MVGDALVEVAVREKEEACGMGIPAHDSCGMGILAHVCCVTGFQPVLMGGDAHATLVMGRDAHATEQLIPPQQPAGHEIGAAAGLNPADGGDHPGAVQRFLEWDDDLSVVVEHDQAEQVISAEVLHDPDTAFLGELERCAAHGAGSVEDDAEPGFAGARSHGQAGSGEFGDQVHGTRLVREDGLVIEREVDLH